MIEVNINELVNKENILNKILPHNIIIVGKIDILIIYYKYDQLDLSKIKCKKNRILSSNR